MLRLLRAEVSLALAALLALAVAAPSIVRAGACARPSLWPGLMTPIASELPAGEGLLVGHHGGLPLTAASQWPSGRAADAFDVVARLERGEEQIALDVTNLAPGLARLVPRTAPARGTWTLVSGEHRHELRVGTSAPPPPLGAPRVREVWHRRSEPRDVGSPRGRSSPSTYLGAELERTPPAGALAVIAVMVIGERSAPRMSRAITTRGLSIDLYQASGGRCAPPSPGEPIPPGSVVRLHWVDAFGRVSPPSNDVTIVAR